MFQAPQRPLDEGALDFDIVLGQLYRRVRDIFYTARRRMRVITDVRSPRKLRLPPYSPWRASRYRAPGTRRFWSRLGFIASTRRVQGLPATLLRNPLPSQWRDLARAGGMASSAFRCLPERAPRANDMPRHMLAPSAPR